MKKITTILFVALVVLGSLPVFASANTNSTMGNMNLWSPDSSGFYRVFGGSTMDVNVFLYAGHNDVFISGNGTTDLDLSVFDGNGVLAGTGRNNGDAEKVCVPNVFRAGYFTARIQNYGKYANDFQLFVRNH